jgi:hypothetical protein
MSGSAGIKEGGRTGLTSVVLGLYALVVAFVFSPLAAAIPHCAVAPVLIFVGASMIGEAKEVAWWRMQEALPAFMCAIFQPFTYSVSNGIYAGISLAFVLFFTTGSFLSYLPGRADSPRKRDSSPLNSLAPTDRYASYNSYSLPAPAQQLPQLSVFKCVSDSEIMNATGDEDSVGLPRLISKMDSFTHKAALKAISSTGSLLGLDKAGVEGVVEDRLLHASRNLEGHCFGGISVCDAEQTCRTLQESVSDLADLIGLVEPPRIAAAALRKTKATRIADM